MTKLLLYESSFGPNFFPFFLLEPVTVFCQFLENAKFWSKLGCPISQSYNFVANNQKCNKFQILLKDRIEKEQTMVLGPKSKSKIFNCFETIYQQACVQAIQGPGYSLQRGVTVNKTKLCKFLTSSRCRCIVLNKIGRGGMVK